ncbi:MAG: hypothetical protein ACOYT8_04120 [Candidatus Dependentiae bacterium]
MKKMFISLILTIPLNSLSMDFFQDKPPKEGDGQRKYLYYRLKQDENPETWGLSAYNIPLYKKVLENHIHHVTEKKEKNSTYKKNLLKKTIFYAVPGLLFELTAAASIHFARDYIGCHQDSNKGYALIALGSAAAIAGFLLSLTGIKAATKYATLNRHLDARIHDNQQILTKLKEYEEKITRKI